MKTITGPWTYRTIEKTIDYPAGDHEVNNEIGAAFEAEKGTDNGGGSAKTGAPGAADAAKG